VPRLADAPLPPRSVAPPRPRSSTPPSTPPSTPRSTPRSTRASGLLVAAAILGLSTAARADDVDAQHWHNLFVQGRIDPASSASAVTSSPSPSSSSSPSSPSPSPSPALYYLELQPRLSLGKGIVERVLLRGAVGAEVLPALTVWAGAGAIPAWTDGRWNPGETRLWQQLQWTPRTAAVGWLLRGRLEQRAFATEPDIATRARAMVRAVVPLPVGDGGFSVVAFDEIFFGLLGPPTRRGFDQNRAFVGVQRRLAPWWTMELGYLHVQVGVPGDDGARQLHTALMQTILNFL
jgi:hypothetical protein